MVSALRQVIARAPGFPPAHSALAKYLAYDAAVAPADQAAAFRSEAKTEAGRALALDPRDADAYVALSLLEPARNWAAREALLRRGVAANPDWPHANGFLAEALAETGRLQEAAGYAQAATAQDRPGQNWQGDGAIILVGAGRISEADAAYAEMVKLWPHSPDDWYLRYLIRIEEGRWGDALAVLDEPVAAQVMAPADMTRARAWLQAAKTGSPQQRARTPADFMAAASASPTALAAAISALATLGDVDDAFTLADGYQPGLARTGATTEFLFLPTTARLRRDPRFMQLAARIGLLGYWRATGRWPDFCRDPGLPYTCQPAAPGARRPAESAPLSPLPARPPHQGAAAPRPARKGGSPSPG
jgi:tetratricopeptide (TPR) repeat protein